MLRSIRKEKHSATKLALLQSFIKRIESHPFEDISIKDICRDAHIAVATFFLYFPHKTSLLDYFSQLWCAELSWRVNRRIGSCPPLAIIEEIFEYTGLRAGQKPELFIELISYLSKKRDWRISPPPSNLELQYAFPDCTGIESVEIKTPWELFSILMELARAKGEIPVEAGIETALTTLSSIYVSAPVLAKAFGSRNVSERYRNQLELLWVGLSSSGKLRG